MRGLMGHKHTVDTHLEHDLVLQAPSEIARVHVATHRHHRRDRLEVIDDPGRADVASVHDPLDTLERGIDLRGQRPVGIRKNADKHG